MQAPNNQPPAQEPPQANATLSGGFWSYLASSGALLWAALGLLPTIIFNYGAAKLNWSVNQSYFWSILAFCFSGIYYPYYAFFVLPPPVASVLGAARRLRR